MHIILDLDETCISSIDIKDVVKNSDFTNCKYFFVYDESNKADMKCYKRPYLDDFLTWCITKFDHVSIWSAGEKNYVLDIVSNIMPKPYTPTFILWRDHCFECEKETGKLKSIAWLKSKIDIKDPIILIDDLKENCHEHCTFNIPRFDPSVKGEDVELLKFISKFEQNNMG
jgi:hypothetical protein